MMQCLMIKIEQSGRRLDRRCLGEVRVQLKMVIKAWCAFNPDEHLNSRNELSGAGGVDKQGRR